MFDLVAFTTSRICLASVTVTPPMTNTIKTGWSLGRGLVTFMKNLDTMTRTYQVKLD